MVHRGEFLKGDFSDWFQEHPTATHTTEYANEGGQTCTICVECGVFQPMAEIEAGLPVRTKA